MANLQELFNRIQETKKEQKQLKNMYREALINSHEYKTAREELEKLKEKKKKIEEKVKDEFSKEFDKLDILKMDIENDNMLLSDAALASYSRGEKVEIIDKNNAKYEPIFTVRFIKIK
jgi:hypothetical protein